ncbi:MAG: dethiobiotin synthase [bacterium]
MHGRSRSPIKANSIFITGTDTGVGKTMVAAAILSVLRGRGIDAVPMKPIQTGCTSRNGLLTAPDLKFSLAAAGLKPDRSEMIHLAPYRFRPACSPHLAARLARRTISTDVISRHFAILQASHDFVVIEGAGGVLVPIGPGQTMLDVMRKLGSPVILVARPGLGTINHTLLSLRALRGAGLDVAGVVFNEATPGPHSYIEKDNIDAVSRHGKVRILGSLPFMPGRNTQNRRGQAFRKWAGSNLDVRAICAGLPGDIKKAPDRQQ